MADPTPDPLTAEISADPYVHTLPDGQTITAAHEVTFPSLAKDRAQQAFVSRGNRGVAVECMRLALSPEDFARLEGLVDRDFFALFNAWMKHCGLTLGESDASTS